ncbi:hypothetical protein FHG87_025462, partial [Trinorchestia longiramus]
AGGLSVTTLARSLFGAFLEGSSSTNQPTTAEQIIGKVKCRRFTRKAKWFTREIKEERMKRKIFNKKLSNAKIV